MTNSLRMPNRSASPRRDSFRQQLFGKPPGSPHDSSYAASMRSMANESSPGDSNFASHSRINRVSFGSITAPPDPSRRSDIQPGSTTTTANLLPSVKAWHTEVWLSAPAAEDRRVSPNFWFRLAQLLRLTPHTVGYMPGKACLTTVCCVWRTPTCFYDGGSQRRERNCYYRCVARPRSSYLDEILHLTH